MNLCPEINTLIPFGKVNEIPVDSGKKVAVVNVLFLPADELDPNSFPRLLLTRRSQSLRSHKGQISFAGGHVDPGETLIAAAKRELKEEVGYSSPSLIYHGTLPQITGLDGTSIVPLVAEEGDQKQLKFTPNRAEVEEIFLVPWSFLTAPHCNAFEFNVFGVKRLSYFYQTPLCNIWGLTALIIKNADFQIKSPEVSS